jgi:hypothetical protein
MVKKKINDDTLLQLIPGWKQLAWDSSTGLGLIPQSLAQSPWFALPRGQRR